MNVGGGGLTGTVSAFDGHVGLGQIAIDEEHGGGLVGFHCVAIVDGSRTIEAGTAVRFRLIAGFHGRWEAAGIEPAPAPGTTARR